MNMRQQVKTEADHIIRKQDVSFLHFPFWNYSLSCIRAATKSKHRHATHYDLPPVCVAWLYQLTFSQDLEYETAARQNSVRVRHDMLLQQTAQRRSMAPGLSVFPSTAFSYFSLPLCAEQLQQCLPVDADIIGNSFNLISSSFAHLSKRLSQNSKKHSFVNQQQKLEDNLRLHSGFLSFLTEICSLELGFFCCSSSQNEPIRDAMAGLMWLWHFSRHFKVFCCSCLVIDPPTDPPLRSLGRWMRRIDWVTFAQPHFILI